MLTIIGGMRSTAKRLAHDDPTAAAWHKRAHWQPLAGLAVEPTREMYLGLPLSTECGLGRHSAEQLEVVSDAWSEL